MIYEKAYKTLQGYECLSSCIGNYLMYDGININASDIFFLGNGFNITYNINEKIIKTDMYEANFKFMNLFGVKYEQKSFTDRISAIEFLKKSVLCEKKVIIKVSSSFIKYNRVFSQSNNSPHYINVIGIKQDEVYISDGFVPTRIASVYEGWISLDQIVSAWEAMEYRCLILNFDKINFDKNMIENNIKFKIQKGIKSYLDGGIYSDFCYGVTAARKLLSELNELILKDNFYESVVFMNYQLRVYGFLSSKNMILAKIRDFGLSANVCEGYENVINMWEKVLLLLIKVGISKKLDTLDELISTVDDCIENERSVLNDIVALWR